MRIVNNKALVVHTTQPHEITGRIKKSAVVEQEGSEYEVAVNWGLGEAQELAKMGIKDVPSPIQRDYQWTGKLTPFAHQKETASFLTLHPKAFCFNEQGTGKTASVIWAADYLMKIGKVRRVLVLCPLSIMKSAWQQDLFKFAMHRSCSVAYGDAKTRAKIIKAGSEFVIINFDGLAIVKQEILDGGFDLVVVDECFVAGTLVATPMGRRPIEQLEAGDKVFTSDGVMRIKRLVRNTTKQLVEVKLGNEQTIKCTPEHPFFTDVGWVCAKNLAGRRLISGVELSCLRAGFSPCAAPGVVGYGEQPPDWFDLFKILCTEEMALDEPRRKRIQQIIARATGQSDGAKVRRASSEGICNIESDWTQTQKPQGERNGYDELRTVDFRGFTCGLGMELPSSVGEEAARLSYELQARLRVAAPKGGVGSRWEQPHGIGATTTRQEEGGKAGGAWVVSVSHIECPSGESVYNLEVEGTPNYFVGGHWLVHNCNAYKNPQTNRWKVLKDVVARCDWLWMLTGTPAAQSPTDAYGLAKLVNPEGSPKYFGQFRDQVMYKVSQFRWIPKPQAQDVVHRVLQPAIRFEKSQCLDLPELTFVERDAPLTAQQAKYYQMLKKQMTISAAGEEITSVNAATNINKLLQISGGAVYSDSKEVVEFDVSNRLKVVLEVIEESSHKVLVFVPFTHTIELLRAELEKNNISCGVINGQVSVNKRSELVTQFQNNPDPYVLIIQPQAASHGLTLTAANTIIWYAPVTSVETYLQANARINRPGQKNAMTIVHIKGSEVETRLYSMLQNNINNHEKIIDLYRQEISKGV